MSPRSAFRRSSTRHAALTWDAWATGVTSAPVPLWCEVGFPSARPHARVGEPFGFLSGRVSGFALVEHHRTGFIPLADTTPLGDPTGDLPPSGFGAGFGELSGLGDGEDTLGLAYRVQRVQPVIKLTA